MSNIIGCVNWYLEDTHGQNERQRTLVRVRVRVRIRVRIRVSVRIGVRVWVWVNFGVWVLGERRTII